jgi:Holliday junction resolvase RusA-like endonuclease
MGSLYLYARVKNIQKESVDIITHVRLADDGQTTRIISLKTSVKEL